MNEEKLAFFEGLLRKRPEDTNLMFWVAFYNQKIAEQMQEDGLEGWEKTLGIAKHWYREAARRGDEEALRALEALETQNATGVVSFFKEEGKMKKRVLYTLIAVVLLLLMFLLQDMKERSSGEKNEEKVIEIVNENENENENELKSDDGEVVLEVGENEDVLKNKEGEKYKGDVNEVDSLELTILRSAIYQFVKDKGRFPYELTELTSELPMNYLSEIPKGGIEMKNEEVKVYDGKGGWLYVPRKLNEEIIKDEKMLNEIIMEVVKPNFPHKCFKKCNFEPLEIVVSKEEKVMWLKTGNVLVAEIEVGIGKENKTPVGEFEISKKVAFPNSHVGYRKNPYGTRAMEISGMEYAIHGTYDKKSIGEEMSLGCVRVENVNMEKLYSLVPLGTKVTITGSGTGSAGEGASASGAGSGAGKGSGTGTSGTGSGVGEGSGTGGAGAGEGASGTGSGTGEGEGPPELKGIGEYDGEMKGFNKEMDLLNTYSWLN